MADSGSGLAGYLDSWQIALRSERKSPQTVKIYSDGLRAFLVWCDRAGLDPVLDRSTLSKFTAALLDGGMAPTTARSRQLAVRRFSSWLADEGIIARDDLIGLKPPKLDRPNVPSLTDAELAALIKACDGKTFMDRRDEAIVRLAVETASRAEEILGMRVADVDLKRSVATIVRGKGGRGRRVPFGPRTALALDRYIRMRRSHRLAGTGALWLGDRGKELAYYGLRNALQRRAISAGISNFHIHRLRHTAASRWLAAGGSEGGLMAVAGWRSRDMLDRYVADTAMSRAADEARALGLGDLLSRLKDDGARVLVTAKCRRRHHIVAELVINSDGLQMIRGCHYRPVPALPGDREWEQVFGSSIRTSSITPICQCGRPHRITFAELEAAAAAGVSVVVVDPVRGSMP